MQQNPQALLACLSYFDIFSHPLTTLEAERFALANVSSLGIAHEKNGFLHCTGKSTSLATRHERYVLSHKKWQRAKHVARVLSYMPFVRAIFVCNSLSYDNATDTSDIDFVVITKTGGIWWARFFCLLLLHILRMRPGQGGHKNKICITTFLDEAHLAINDWMINARDIDFVYWVVNFYPLYDTGDMYNQFWNANAHWISRYVPNAWPIIPHPNRQITNTPRVRRVIEFVLQPFGGIITWMQKKRFPKEIVELQNRDSRVRVEEGRLKFHVHDNRAEHNNIFWMIGNSPLD